jgi:hypothetical protein
MCESVMMGFGVPIRPPWVPVPAFPDSSLPGVDRITESRTVYLCPHRGAAWSGA